MSEQPYLATVIICTRDRAASLSRTLESIAIAAEHVNGNWEFIVVDNGSRDDTANVIESFAPVLPIRRVEQIVPGLSNARNAGVVASQGKFVIWTDDDVVVDRKWLQAWFDAFVAYPEAVVFGGRALPVYEQPAPEWFRRSEDKLRSLLAIRDFPELTRIDSKVLPFGLNYAIRGEEQRSALYDPELGVAPGRRRGGEEEALIQGLLKAGATGRWVWSAHVDHIIPASRQNEDYIATYYRAAGYNHPVIGFSDDDTLLRRGWRILKAAKVWATGMVRLRSARQAEPALRVSPLIEVSKAEGSLRRYFGLDSC